MTKLGAARLVVLAFLLLVAPLAAEAEAQNKVWRVAVLTSGMPRSDAPVRALEQRLAELGYVEGRNLVIDFRTAGAQIDRLPALAAELVGGRPDIFVAVSTQGGMAAKNATRTIPIILAAVGDPVGTGIVPSLGRPGGNITGVSLLNVEMSGKGLQLLKEAVPAASRVAVLWSSGNRLHREGRTATEAAAATLKVGLQFHDVRGPDDLMCYGPNLVENFRAAAGYIDRVLKGATAGDLPIAQATKFDLVINLKTAKVLGLTIPPSLLLQADTVIQ